MIWWDKFICNFKYIFTNEISFIKKKKKIVIVVGKLTRSRVLLGGMGLHGGPRGEDWAGKFFPSCGAGRGRDGLRQNHVGWGRKPHPSDPSRPIAIPLAPPILFLLDLTFLIFFFHFAFSSSTRLTFLFQKMLGIQKFIQILSLVVSSGSASTWSIVAKVV